MSKITKEEVGLDDSLTKDTRSAPVTYVNILQHEDVTISMFVLRHKSSLPLHDHPLMHGVIKVVSGILEIQNYSFVEDPSDIVRHRIVCARKEIPKTVGVNDSPVILTPTNGNIHEITCTGHDGAAFVDVLAPPYGSVLPNLGPRPCFYYFEVPDQPAHSEIVKFVKSQNHPEFWTDDAPYLGR
ncbi:Protein of unknown function (DUF1637) [Nesidiocoris tenuis]|nr:Protein of unknown function (DUF1637) [Nesidiocoris tenuis]